MNKNKGIEPNVSYDDFVLGSNIKQHLNRKHVKEHFDDTPSLANEYVYSFIDEDISVWCDEDGTIESIECWSSCIFHGIELINMKYTDFIELIHEQPDDQDFVYVEVGEKEQREHVYTFYRYGLQIYTYRNRIRSVNVSKYEDD